MLRSGRSFGKDSPANYWLGIIDCLNTLLSTLKENFVCSLLASYFVRPSNFIVSYHKLLSRYHQLLFRRFLHKLSHMLMCNSLTGKLVPPPPLFSLLDLLFLFILGYLWLISIQISNFHWLFSLLLRRECCTFSNGEYVKSGLAELELWCCQAKEEVNFFRHLIDL